MSMLERNKFHQAARDGYLDLLKEATRKDCNCHDEDGMTPVLWSAYHGNLDALRTLVGRGGNPDKCDITGNTALHWATTNGHMNCVSFLVNFGVNIWSLNNEYQTAKDVAAIQEKADILNLMDQVLAKQSALNPKVVQRLKEKAIIETEKRIKNLEKLQKKASKRAEKEDKHLEKQVFTKPITTTSSSTSLASTLRRDSLSTIMSSSLKFSDIVNTHGTMTSKVKGIGAVSRKVLFKKQHNDTISAGDFKIRENGIVTGIESGEINSNGSITKSSVKSLTGLRRDNDVLYIRKQNNNNHYSNNNITGNRLAGYSDCHKNNSDNLISSKIHLKNLFNNQEKTRTKLTRTKSEPEFMSFNQTDSGLGDVDLMPPPESSMFERPGFGSVAFRHSLLAAGRAFLQSGSNDSSEDLATIDSIHEMKTVNGKSKISGCAKENGASSGSCDDSIGSAGSLAQRNATCSVASSHGVWNEQFVQDIINENHKPNHQTNNQNGNRINHVNHITSPIISFLTVHGLIEYKPLFEEERIDLEALILLNEDDLKSLGLPLGPRRKILKAMELRRQKLENPGALTDSQL